MARQRTAFSTLVENNTTITVGARLYDACHRSRTEYDRQRLTADALRAWRLNPLARRIVRLYRQFALGDGLRLQGAAPGPAAEFLSAFWHHPLNDLDEQAPEWFDERTLTGNLFLLFTCDPAGFPLVRAIPAEEISEIRVRANDTRQEVFYAAGLAGGEGYPAFDPAGEPQGSFMRHYAINRPAGCAWGESDLFPLLPWLARYTAWLENRARLNYYRSVFCWILRAPFKSEAERIARQRALEAVPPQPGSILVCPDNEQWEVQAPRLEADQAGEDGLALKKMIALGAGLPLHFLAEPESSTRTTAAAADLPAFRNLAEYQQSFCRLMGDVLRMALILASRSDPRLQPSIALSVQASPLNGQEQAGQAQALAQAEGPLADLFDRKLIDSGEFLGLIQAFTGQPFPDHPNRPEGLRRPLSARGKPTLPTSSPLSPFPAAENDPA